MDLQSRMRPDGLVPVWHFQDGWIFRQSIDVREIVRNGQGAMDPTEAQFRAAVQVNPAAAGWPQQAGQPPHWFIFAVSGIPTPSAVPAAAAPVLDVAPPAGAPVFADDVTGADQSPAPAKKK